MKVAGEAVVRAPIQQVWAALNDPAVLVRTIPGCQRLEATGTDSYAMTVTAGVASIKGTYSGTVALSDQHEPNSFLMRASGSGAPGTVSADVRVALSEVDQGTQIDYAADAVVGGVIGGVGQRMLGGVAKKMAGEFFAGVEAVLTGQAELAPAANSAAPGPVGAGAAPGSSMAPTGPGVFLAPPSSKRGIFAVGDGDFGMGVVLGAAIALLGVLVGSRATAHRAGSGSAGPRSR